MRNSVRFWQVLIWLAGLLLLLAVLGSYPDSVAAVTAITICWSLFCPHIIGRLLTKKYSMPPTTTPPSSTSSIWAVMGIIVVICFVCEAIFKAIYWVLAK